MNENKHDGGPVCIVNECMNAQINEQINQRMNLSDQFVELQTNDELELLLRG